MVYSARDLLFHYGQQSALQRVSFSIASGERVALLGANGSGKSTLLRLLNGLIFPESGELRFHQEAITAQRLSEREFSYEFRRRVGFVFQNPDAQLFNGSVFDEVAFGPLQLRWPKHQIRERVEAMLESMNIADLRYRSPHRLSGGEKKRVALASVLVYDPEVLLLDEPLAALDPKSESEIVALLASWSGSAKTVVMATHDLQSLEEVADRCIVLETGRVVGEGSPLQVLHNAALLQQTRLIHPHKHKHRSGEGEVHPHLHIHQGDSLLKPAETTSDRAPDQSHE